MRAGFENEVFENEVPRTRSSEEGSN